MGRCIFESDDTRIDRESAAATRVFESSSRESRTRHGVLRRLGKRQMCFFLSYAKGREEKKVPVTGKERDRTSEMSRVLSFPRDAHYANGDLPSRLSTD